MPLPFCDLEMHARQGEEALETSQHVPDLKHCGAALKARSVRSTGRRAPSTGRVTAPSASIRSPRRSSGPGGSAPPRASGREVVHAARNRFDQDLGRRGPPSVLDEDRAVEEREERACHPMNVPEIVDVTSRIRRTPMRRNSARHAFALVAHSSRPKAEWTITRRTTGHRTTAARRRWQNPPGSASQPGIATPTNPSTLPAASCHSNTMA